MLLFVPHHDQPHPLLSNDRANLALTAIFLAVSF